MTIQTLKRNAVKDFTSCGFSTPQLDADCLFQFLLNKDKTWILLHGEDELSEELVEQFNALVEKRRTGLPIAYITGKKEFYGIEYVVTPDVLIPKPDTEILVEKALEYLNGIAQPAGAGAAVRVIDVCSGSGCVGLSILKEVNDSGKNIIVDLTQTDLSKAALAITEKNARNIFGEEYINSKKIKFLNGDLLCGESGYDVIVSNPPYVPHSDVEKLLLDGRSEPRLALDGDVDAAVAGGAGSVGNTDSGWLIDTCGAAIAGKENSDDNTTTGGQPNAATVSKEINVGNTTTDGKSGNAITDGLGIIKRLIPMAYDALNHQGVFLMESGEYQTEQVRALFTDAGFINVHSEKDLSGMERITIGEKQ